MFISVVKQYLKKYNINDDEARQILEDIEKQVGHNHNLIKATVDFEGENLIKRLKRKQKKKKEVATAAY